MELSHSACKSRVALQQTPVTIISILFSMCRRIFRQPLGFSFTDLPIAYPRNDKLSTVGLGLPLGWQLRCSQVLLFPAWNAPNHLVHVVGELSMGIFSFTGLQTVTEASTFGGQFSWNPRHWNGTTEVKSTEWNVDESSQFRKESVCRSQMGWIWRTNYGNFDSWSEFGTGIAYSQTYQQVASSVLEMGTNVPVLKREQALTRSQNAIL